MVQLNQGRKSTELILEYVIPKGVSEARVFISGRGGVPTRAAVARLGWE